MDKTIKEIFKIIGHDEYSELCIKVYPDEVIFFIYDSEIPITYNPKNGAYIDTELGYWRLDEKTLEELTQIVKVINNNKESLSEYINR